MTELDTIGLLVRLKELVGFLMVELVKELMNLVIERIMTTEQFYSKDIDIMKFH